MRFRNNALDDERIRRRIESSKDADTLLEQLIKTEDLLKAANSALETANGENHTLKQNLDALIGASPVALTEEAREPEVPTDEPASVVAAVELAEASTQHLLYLPSAIESAKESPYRSPDRALEALQAIDEVAGLWIAGLNGAKNPGPLKLLFKQRGFEYKDDVSQTSRGKWSEEYSASYDGRPIDISPHITIGAKQADTCLSIHMHWDKESKKVIVAHIGRHKINTKT